MARYCPVCKGKGYFGKNACRVCEGSGWDPNWLSKNCAHCGGEIEYHAKWAHVPDYCESCRQPRSKSCASCGRTIEYKVYWSHVPDYCESCRQTSYKTCPACGGQIAYKHSWSHIPEYCSCKGWKTKPCSWCHGEIHYHYEWNNVPEYCKDCLSWKTIDCKGCGTPLKYKVFWEHIPLLCPDCRKMSKRRGYELCYGNELESYMIGAHGVKVSSSPLGDDYQHVTLWVPGGHVSAEVHRYSTRSVNFHKTLDVFDENGRKVDKIPWAD